MPDPFHLANNAAPATPVILAVPHAGRAYPAERSRLRAPLGSLRALEDRHADALVDQAIKDGVPTIIATAPRLWIDLNRAESDLDPAMGRSPTSGGGPLSVRARGGLGLIPRRLSAVGEIWHLPLDAQDIAARIVTIHRPYHTALAAMIANARARFGCAVLIDFHSMPSLAGPDAAQIVIGDRFGRSADAAVTASAEAHFLGAGYRVAINAPYAGGHSLERHGKPDHGVQALQIEIDRRLYLDESLDAPGPGLAAMQFQIAALAARLGGQASGPRLAIAAE